MNNVQNNETGPQCCLSMLNLSWYGILEGVGLI